MVKSYIEIRKSDIKRELKKQNVRWKHQDDVCRLVKSDIMVALPDIISKSIIDTRLKGNHTLKEFYKN